MDINQFINLLAMIVLIEMMITIGLGVALSEVAAVAADWRLLIRAAIANYILVPVIAFVLLFLFKAEPYVAAGFLVIAVCPGAPYGPPFTSIARGNVPVAVGLMVILAGSSAVLAPLLLRMLLPLLARNAPISINAGKMIVTLMVGQFLPLIAGLAIRRLRPGLAERLKKPGARLSTALNLALLTVIIAAQFRMLAAIHLTGYVGMLVLLALIVAAGMLMGGRTAEGRKTMTITTAVRNAGVGLVIATGSFAGTAAVTAATAYALIQTVGMALVAVAWGRAMASSPARVHAGAGESTGLDSSPHRD